jgi:dUTP pyrophosphatase
MVPEEVLRVKLFTDTAKLPEKAHHADGGYDLFADEAVRIKQGSRAKVRLGIGVGIPQGYVGLMLARSGLSVKKGSIVLAPVVDSGYTGAIHLVVINHGDGPWDINVGDKVAQLVISPCLDLPVVSVKKLDGERGSNGFGSSD